MGSRGHPIEKAGLTDRVGLIPPPYRRNIIEDVIGSKAVNSSSVGLKKAGLIDHFYAIFDL